VFRAEDAAADTAYNIIATYATWQRLFGGDPGIIGRAVRVNGITRTIIGVLPRGFVAPMPGEIDFYFALDFHGAMRDPVRLRRQQNYGFVGRLKPGITVEAAREDLSRIGKDLAREYPQFNGSARIVAMPIRESMVGDTRKALLVLLASAGLVLLITCANLAGALLSRGLTRRREFAVRVALGAGPRDIRQLVVGHGVRLAVFGVAIGLALSFAVTRALSAFLFGISASDPLTYVGTAVVLAVVAMAASYVPARNATRTDPLVALRQD